MRTRPPSALQRFVQGAGMFWRGIALWCRRPRLMALGMLPGALTFVLMVVLVITVLSNLRPLATGLVNLVDATDSGWATLAEMLVAFGLVVAVLLLAVYTFATVTLLIGGPFFERISAHIDSELGHQPVATSESAWKGIGRSVGEGLWGLVVTIVVGLLLFLVNLVPVIGTAAALVGGASIGGWFLAMELTAFPAARRGYVTRRQRRALLKARRGTAMGFGAMTFLIFLVPGGAVLGMPAASAGATLVVRSLLNEPMRPPGSDGGRG